MKRAAYPENITEPEARKLWRSVQAEFELDDTGIEILRTGIYALNNALKWQRHLDRTGPIYTSKDKNGKSLIKVNPLATMIFRERQTFLACLRQLDLQTDDEPKRGPGRPLGRIG